jgi:hypothetical protein
MEANTAVTLSLKAIHPSLSLFRMNEILAYIRGLSTPEPSLFMEPS